MQGEGRKRANAIKKKLTEIIRKSEATGLLSGHGVDIGKGLQHPVE